MSGLIDRQMAIDAIKKCRNESDMPDMWNDGMSCALRCIYRLPSAQPEITEEQVREYCRKRCLSVIDSALLAKYVDGRKEIRFWDAFPSGQAVLWRDEER